MYIAHKSKEGAEQPLKVHLENVANLSSEFAKAFGVAEHARRNGLLHDKGKYGERAQNRQRDPEHTQKVPHAYAGAQAAQKERDVFGAFAIAGHHGGLMDRIQLVNGKLSQPSENLSAFDEEIQFQHGALEPSWLKMPKNEQDKAACSMYTRMLFSCLVDADYYSKKMTELMGMLHESYPKRLSLEDQGIFQLGYYHQTQQLYQKKED